MTADDAPRTGRQAVAEVHIAGVLVQVQPHAVPDVATAISVLPGAEVTHTTADGKIVAVLERPSSHAVLAQIEALRPLPGVLDVALVYQHAEPLEDMNKEVIE